MSIALISAYGRRYDSKDAAIIDWDNGRDFKIVGGPYTSIRDKELLNRDYGDVNVYWNYPYTDDHFVA